MGLLAEAVRREFGFDVIEEFPPKVVSVATTPTNIVPANPDRVMLAIQNIGAYDVYIHFDETVSVTKGLLCSKAGGGWVFYYKEDGVLPGLPWYGVGDGGSSNVYVVAVKGR